LDSLRRGVGAVSELGLSVQYREGKEGKERGSGVTEKDATAPSLYKIRIVIHGVPAHITRRFR
jgi:hypothetical protein